MARKNTPCPCGLGKPYGSCCGRLHRGEAVAATPEELMRSRYSAFAVGDAGYLRESWHPSTRPATIDLDSRPAEWTRLEILSTSGGSAFHTDGTVEFRAHYRADGEEHVHAEHSTFTRENGRWFYVSETR
ncbi:YchJ family protein [Amycolatopsis acidicola]|uniref:UPF0225 protein FPZ12_035170 n=1 Tax=Amycolatopsis acidicola TaxID=2596893 RepID=A0A5N0UPY4_9PSEU|nr:YchJ family protein [Amycolatopsis acidicola]KAA9153163.1 YchJ family protein [Amycolatopsis acidicola]